MDNAGKYSNIINILTATSELEFLDLGIIIIIIYRKSLLEFVIAEKLQIIIVPSVTILHAICWVAQAWKSSIVRTSLINTSDMMERWTLKH